MQEFITSRREEIAELCRKPPRAAAGCVLAPPSATTSTRSVAMLDILVNFDARFSSTTWTITSS